jgi:uncharacterized protein (DUF362 family)
MGVVHTYGEAARARKVYPEGSRDPEAADRIEAGEEYILASGDMVAIDAISTKMMGFDPLSIPDGA